jgi:uncharacterized membrane protein HdeD (DUF308 family)
MTARVFSLVLAFAAWLATGLPLLAGLLWGLTLKCDDSCSSIGGWRHDPDAWQWNGIAALGVVVFLSGAALFLFVWWRKPLLAAGATIVGLVAMFVLANAFSSDWINHFDRRSPGELLVIAAGVFAPIFAILLTPRR